MIKRSASSRKQGGRSKQHQGTPLFEPCGCVEAPLLRVQEQLFFAAKDLSKVDWPSSSQEWKFTPAIVGFGPLPGSTEIRGTATDLSLFVRELPVAMAILGFFLEAALDRRRSPTRVLFPVECPRMFRQISGPVGILWRINHGKVASEASVLVVYVRRRSLLGAGQLCQKAPCL